MKSSITLALSTLAVGSLTAFNLGNRGVGDPAGIQSSFDAEIHGDVAVHPRGDARFGVVNGQGVAPNTFILSLGADADDGSILFTRQSGDRLSLGTYPVSDRGDGTDDVQALVVTGSATRPTGVFHGRAGTLVVTAASDTVIGGYFQIDGTGFLASEAEAEDRIVSVSGSFTATRD